MFKESRFIFEKGAPEGAQCSESARQKFNAQESWEARGKLSQRILSGEEPVCGPEEKAEAKEQLKQYVAVKKHETGQKYQAKALELLLSDKPTEALNEERWKLTREFRRENLGHEKMLAMATLFGHFDSLPEDEKRLIERVPKKVVADSTKVEGIYGLFFIYDIVGDTDVTAENVDDLVLDQNFDNYEGADTILSILRSRGGELAPEKRAVYYAKVAGYLSSVDIDLAEEFARKAARMLAVKVEAGDEKSKPFLSGAYVQLADVLKAKQEKSGKMEAPDDKVLLFYELGGDVDAFSKYVHQFENYDEERVFKFLDRADPQQVYSVESFLGYIYRKLIESEWVLNGWEQKKALVEKVIAKWAKDRDALSGYGNVVAAFDAAKIYNDWYGKGVTPEMRREMLGEFFPAEEREEILKIYEDAPETAEEYRKIIDGEGRLDGETLHLIARLRDGYAQELRDKFMKDR